MTSPSSSRLPAFGSATGAPVVLQPIPLRTLAPWLVLGSLLAFGVLFLVSAEQSSYVHEWMHDGRHLLGFPCH
jgi:cobalt transporter subunit CbtB